MKSSNLAVRIDVEMESTSPAIANRCTRESMRSATEIERTRRARTRRGFEYRAIV